MSAINDGLHSVILTIDGFGSPHLDFRCHADKTADPKCHMVCPQDGCEEGCHHPDEHEFENSQECMIRLWLDESDAIECVIGPETSVEVPIAYVWHGEGVDWAFADAKGGE